MRIGVEANALTNPAGTGVLTRHLVEELRARGHDISEFTHGYHAGRSTAQRWLNGLRQIWWTQVTLARAARHRRVDVLLCPAYVGPFRSRVPLVLMILDLTFLIEPETGDRLYMRYLHRLVPALVERAARILTISQSAAAEIARLLPAAAGKLAVAYPGPGSFDNFPPPGQSPASLAGEGQGGGSPYILMVGTLEPRKNYGRALEAFRIFLEMFPGWRLRIVGSRGWGGEQTMFDLERLGISDSVEFLGHIDPASLSGLYRRASLLFYPSLYEGFGFPILEAMACGCPVVTSNRSSMAEIGNGAAELVDPLDPGAMAAGLRAVAGDPQRRAELIEKGRRRALDFSWNRFGAAVERALIVATTPDPS